MILSKNIDLLETITTLYAYIYLSFYMMRLRACILTGIHIALYLTPGQVYVRELWISFLPLGSSILTAFTVLALWVHIYQTNKVKDEYEWSIWRALRKSIYTYMLVGCIAIQIFFVQQWIWIYHINNRQHDTNSFIESINDARNSMSIYVANIYALNTNYQAIQNIVEKHDPDILVLIEYEPHHHQALSSQRSSTYTYNNIQEEYIPGKAVFSKFPLELRPVPLSGPWRFDAITIQHPKQAYQSYIVHTAAPISQALFDNRNRQREILTAYFTRSIITDATIIMGDFNTTPRSSYYQKFIDILPADMYHISTYLPPHNTRSRHTQNREENNILSFLFQPIQAHIDHVFLTSDIQLHDAQLIYLPGSDHRGYLYTISTQTEENRNSLPTS